MEDVMPILPNTRAFSASFTLVATRLSSIVGRRERSRSTLARTPRANRPRRPDHLQVRLAPGALATTPRIQPILGPEPGHSAATSTATCGREERDPDDAHNAILPTWGFTNSPVPFTLEGVTVWMVLPYFVIWATLMNALFVKAKWLPPNCAPRAGRRPTEGDHCYCEYGR